eukprot:CAMPEP_0116139782 /NCGR_PEP_ID=MMETSP0329-20121206/13493_1 /TAXON_ID=697910 /ORGANISM="Pseudo-nitzschia arenysensis, Strain B593" /LENGTH=34 /DNA_ID= /DNA_START= /DNA_END= /DNA_ORIENTATION=
MERFFTARQLPAARLSVVGVNGKEAMATAMGVLS